MGGVAAFLAWRFLWQSSSVLTFIWWNFLCLGFLIAAFIDLELYLLPDEIILPGLAVSPFLFTLTSLSTGPGADPIGKKIALFISRSKSLISGFPPWIVPTALCVLFGWFFWSVARKAKPVNKPLEVFFPAAFFVLGAALGLCLGYIGTGPERFSSPALQAMLSSLLGALIGALLILFIRVLGQWAFAQEAMGFGDVKLAGFLGAVTGPAGVLWTLAIASVAGSLIGVLRYAFTRERHLPFGPFLILGSCIAVFWRNQLQLLLAAYSRLLGLQ